MATETAVTLFIIGICGGAWNALSGGATLFTFPALMMAGLPPIVANATNFVALSPANAAALPPYLNEIRSLGSRLVPLLVISGGGSVLGACLLLVTHEALFLAMVPFLILVATILFTFGERARAFLVAHANPKRANAIALTSLFVFSIYGGYFGAGLGIILLAVSQILGYAAFHTANTIKNVLSASLTALTIAVFGAGGIITWPEATLMMAGSTIGGYLGGRYARFVSDAWLRCVVTTFGVVLSLIYFNRIWMG